MADEAWAVGKFCAHLPELIERIKAIRRRDERDRYRKWLQDLTAKALRRENLLDHENDWLDLVLELGVDPGEARGSPSPAPGPWDLVPGRPQGTSADARAARCPIGICVGRVPSPGAMCHLARPPREVVGG